MNPWLTGELTAHFRTAFQEITGERAEVDCVEQPPSGCGFHWRQPFSALPGAVWIAALDGSSLQAIQRAFSGMAQAFSGLLDREVRVADGEERPTPPAQLAWMQFDLLLSNGAITLFAGVEPELLKAISIDGAPRDITKTFDLLFDVDLPVSVSFGRAQVALKDVLKLTTGSIIELNRAVGDPVEVIVNNCVIARGEVVTIEGNFGVRIHQVISRGERLRTLK